MNPDDKLIEIINYAKNGTDLKEDSQNGDGAENSGPRTIERNYTIDIT